VGAYSRIGDPVVTAREEILAAVRTANGAPMPDDVIMLAVSPA